MPMESKVGASRLVATLAARLGWAVAPPRALLVGGLALLTLAAQPAFADARSQAKRLHDRIAGVPASAAVLDDMAADIAAGRSIEAAYTAMENRSFYDVTLKNFAMPWTNRDQTMFAPLNDYVATVIGMVRDDTPTTRRSSRRAPTSRPRWCGPRSRPRRAWLPKRRPAC